ncbi:MAG: translocation/assembly module TamB [Flavobacteriaceae bacterium]|nr:translocation/assembly module TamB [Flavobacteriaceae bacterium]
MAKSVTSNINAKYGTTILVDKVDLSSLRNLELKNILILDHHQDSLIFISRLSTSILNFKNILNANLMFGDIEIENGQFLLKTYKDEYSSNLTILSRKFKKASNNDKVFQLTSSSVRVNNLNFTYIDENRNNKPIVFYNDISGYFDDFKIYNTTVSASIHDFQTIDNHNIHVVNLKTEFLYSDTKMEFLDTELKTENSNLSADLVFNYKLKDFSNFTDKIKIEADIKNADVALIDLKKFYNEFGKNDIIHFKTKLKGTLNDFILSNLNLKSNRNFILQGKFHLKNSFKTEEFKLNARIKKVTSNYENLTNLLPNLLGKKIPTSVEKIGNFTSSGQVNITRHSVYSKLQTQSDIGSFKTDIKLSNINNINKATYIGKIELEHFNLGKVINNPLVGHLSMVSEVEGQGFKMNNVNTKIKGLISKYQYKGYTYSNIDINGVFKDKLFNGELIVNDPNIKLTFKGLADLSKKDYVFDFKANVDHANFHTLNLFKRDSISVLKGKIDINLKGHNLDNIVGDINFKEFTYINQNGEYYFKDFDISSKYMDSIREIRVNSTDIINGFVKGNFKFKELKKITINSLESLYVNYQKDKVSKGQFLEFNFNIYNKIIEVFFPKVKLGANTIIRGKIDSDLDKIELLIKSPEVIAFENKIENIRLQVDNNNPLYHTILSVDKVNTKYYDVADLTLVNVTLNDTLFMRTDLIGGKELKEKFNLSFYHTINENNQSIFGIKKSEIDFKNNIWSINPENNNQNKLVFNQSFKTFAIDKINMVSGNQHVDLAGFVYDSDNENIDLKFENVNLFDITPHINNISVDGKINGIINLKKVNGSTLPFADIIVNYFSINDDYYGDLTFNARGDKSIKNYNYQAKLVNGDLISFYSKGKIDFTPKSPTISAELNFDKFKINSFSPLGGNVLSKIRGYASGRTFVSGEIINPIIDGKIILEEGGLAIPYLNVNYNLLGKSVVELYDQTFYFKAFDAEDDMLKTKGVIDGTISHKNFKNWFLDLEMLSDNLLVLNTKETENTLYYGTGFLSGSTRLVGLTDDLTIDIEGKTNPGTEFIIPLSYLSTVSNTNLIHFENPLTIKNDNKETKEIIFEELKGLTVRFNLEVTKDAIAQVVIDKVSGSLLRGSGEGNLELYIDTNGKFEMYGVLVVDNGEYQFKNIINKDFAVKKGGTVIWNGNPYDAELNIVAINNTKANPSILLNEVSSSRKIDVELITLISGTLSAANFEFDINIPNASSLVSSELEFKLNNDDEKLTQFFSLLATGSFINLDQRNAAFGNAAISGTIAQKASNILNQILKTNNDFFEIGVTYDVGRTNSVEDVITDDQLGLSVSVGITDRVTVNGKVGVPVGSNTNSRVIGEAEIVLPLNEAETFKVKAYNRQNEIQFDALEGEGYTQGVGISYQFDFDNGNEFLQKLGLKKTKEQKEAAKKKKDSLSTIKKD